VGLQSAGKTPGEPVIVLTGAFIRFYLSDLLVWWWHRFQSREVAGYHEESCYFGLAAEDGEGYGV